MAGIEKLPVQAVFIQIYIIFMMTRLLYCNSTLAKTFNIASCSGELYMTRSAHTLDHHSSRLRARRNLPRK